MKLCFGCAIGTALAVSSATAMGGVTQVAAGFDQIANINALGGTVFQIGGGTPGLQLFTSADFNGPAATSISSSTGVSVSLPNYVFASTSTFNGVGNEPGNVAFALLGTPTDLTFTSPGGTVASGPDFTNGGDGSVQFISGSVGTLFYGLTTAIAGGVSDVVIFTNTAGGGRADIEFLLNGNVVDSVLNITVPGGGPGSGHGGLVLNLNDGLSFDTIRVRGRSGSVEIDAIGVLIPTPGAAALLGLGGLVAARRRR